MGFVNTGGFIVTAKSDNYVYQVRVDDDKFVAIIKALDIPPTNRAALEKIKSDILSIYIYRGD
jgi:hypothetical protein